ncbi:MAG: hypothetical protein IPI44_24510 [Sulfuritalea sp.]|nr:hypothetical protein [Sulfuritalea sp.]
MSKPLEPTLDALPNPLLSYFAATRPAFLSVTFVGCLLGLATAAYSGIAIGPALATATLFFALVAHAGANVINDYYDALSGCDGANTERQFPFTGGSRFIQNVPATTLVALLPAAASIAAATPALVARGATGGTHPALKLTILAASAHGLLLAILLVMPWNRVS